MEANDKKQLKPNELSIIGDWIPRQAVKQFFGYGNTKMASFATDHNVTVSKVGKRIFYKYSDILRLINENIQTDSIVG